MDGRGLSATEGGWCTTTGSSVVRVTIERRDKSEGSERSAFVQSVPGKRIIDFTGISISAGIVRAIRHTRGGFCFFMRAVRGDLRENIALTMAFWRAWHARLGEGRVETGPRGKMIDSGSEERAREDLESDAWTNR